MALARLKIKELPRPLSFRSMLGPSIILLGLGLGSGEVILWPFLTSQYGMGLIWAAMLGLTFQFFMNMEIERYALARGESVFVGFRRKYWWAPLWFLLSTFVPWIWPGIVGASGALFAELIGYSNGTHITIGMLLAIGVLLTLGPVLYKTVESFQKILVMVSVPTVIGITVLLARAEHWHALARGLVGIGDGFMFIPAGISMATFLAAFAYSGAGGNLNLAQSYYVREKGYGMGKYAGRITSLLLGKTERIELEGSRFEQTPSQIARFKTWWRVMNLEHSLVFWFTGALTICSLALLAYITMYGQGMRPGVGFVVDEALSISAALGAFFGVFFLMIASATLFGTQLTVFDASSRILAENIILLKLPGLSSPNMLRPLYYVVLWAQILAGIGVFAFGFTEPLQLLTLAAVLNASAMFVHVMLTVCLNMTHLEPALRPSFARKAMLTVVACFYGGFSIYMLIQAVKQFFT